MEGSERERAITIGSRAREAQAETSDRRVRFQRARRDRASPSAVCGPILAPPYIRLLPLPGTDTPYLGRPWLRTWARNCGTTSLRFPELRHISADLTDLLYQVEC
jgi:hypothetical protein